MAARAATKSRRTTKKAAVEEDLDDEDLDTDEVEGWVSAWSDWLADRPDSRPAVWLLFAPGTATGDFAATVDAMLAAEGTGHPLVNGYSGFFPTDHAERRRRLARFPDDVSLDELRDRDVGYVVADAPWLATDGREAAAIDAGLTIAERDDEAVLLTVAPG